MRSSTTILCVLLVFFSYGQSIDVVELKQPKSNKVIIKLMFRNGSISDPINRSGLTNLTANLMTQGGTKDYSFDEIQKLIYPMAAQYEVLVDKEISDEQMKNAHTIVKEIKEKGLSIVKNYLTPKECRECIEYFEKIYLKRKKK